MRPAAGRPSRGAAERQAVQVAFARLAAQLESTAALLDDAIDRARRATPGAVGETGTPPRHP